MISSSQIIIIRQLWHYYLENNDALIWVVDSCDRERFVEVKEELHDLMQDDRKIQLAGSETREDQKQSRVLKTITCIQP